LGSPTDPIAALAVLKPIGLPKQLGTITHYRTLVQYPACMEKTMIWTEGGDDSFAAIPPNAALSFLGEEESHDVVVVLKSPRMDGKTLVYDVDVLEGPEAISGKGAALFIDVIGRPLTPISVAGGRRRVRRRTRRRVERRN
jgi:hypothetical protein